MKVGVGVVNTLYMVEVEVEAVLYMVGVEAVMNKLGEVEN
jgi:hypothetical protein